MPPPIPPLRATRGRLTDLLILAVPLLLGADDSYLREIEAEVKRQAATLATGQARPEPSAASAADAAADRLAPGLDQAAFERALRATLPGTYTLYQQLDSDRRKQVYDAYQNDNRLASISAQVARGVGGKP
jgi:hypothetical protein